MQNYYYLAKSQVKEEQFTGVDTSLDARLFQYKGISASSHVYDYRTAARSFHLGFTFEEPFVLSASPGRFRTTLLWAVAFFLVPLHIFSKGGKRGQWRGNGETDWRHGSYEAA